MFCCRCSCLLFFFLSVWHGIQKHSSELLLVYVLSLNDELEAVSLLLEANKLNWILNKLATPLALAPLIKIVYFVASCLGI